MEDSKTPTSACLVCGGKVYLPLFCKRHSSIYFFIFTIAFFSTGIYLKKALGDIGSSIFEAIGLVSALVGLWAYWTGGKHEETTDAILKILEERLPPDQKQNQRLIEELKTSLDTTKKALDEYVKKDERAAKAKEAFFRVILVLPGNCLKKSFRKKKMIMLKPITTSGMSFFLI